MDEVLPLLANVRIPDPDIIMRTVRKLSQTMPSSHFKLFQPLQLTLFINSFMENWLMNKDTQFHGKIIENPIDVMAWFSFLVWH